MAVTFKIPKSPTKQVYESTIFLGADFTSEASTVDQTKSPNCENMIRSVPGKIRKRMGYEEVADYEDPIYGVHYYSVLNTWIVHAGQYLYDLNGILGGKWVASSAVTKVVVYPRDREFNPEDHYYIAHESSWTSSEAYYYCVQDARFIETPTYAGFTYQRKTVNVIYNGRINSEHRPDGVYPRDNFITEYTVTFYYISNNAASEDIDYIVNEDQNHIMLLDGKVENTRIYEGMAEHKSVGFELGGKLIIFDGTSAKYVDKDGHVGLVSDIAYIPLLVYNKDPDGGGQDNEAINLLQPGWIEQFYVRAHSDDPNYNPSTIVNFQLTFGNLDAKTVKAWVKNQNMEWVEKTEGTDFTVDRTSGVVTFSTAPGASPVEGEDNVKIQAYKTVAGYADRINHCTIGVMWGVNGAHDRIFASGNPDSGVNDSGDPYTYINCDWYSGYYDPTYWPDTGYSKLGADNSAIMGYSVINNLLATHKDKREKTQSILIRQGDYNEEVSEPVFKLVNSLQGAGAISKHCFSTLETEPVFLTELGIYAITPQDVTGEKYAQDRSYYLEGKLLKEEGLENAHAFTWKDYYILSVNDHLYVLDGLQPLRTDKSTPYSTRQYAGFYFTNIPATCFFEKDGYLYFGSAYGKMYRFFKDDKDIYSYSDDGEPIYSVWETADIDELLFYKKKTYRYVAVRCLPEIQSSLKVSVQKDGIWQELKNDLVKLKYFSYANLIYSKLTYSTNMTQRISATKIRVKKLDHVRFKFENEALNEPLGINDFAVEYTQAGNVK